ncbi:uncharacterized protein LOC123534357 [Mercenaria mercenaria]|uniref:uncharacterized protein LOC123534357 n=1 Tax=Mercenaria mercenaria TaxID=6596 RepID=UPI00234EE1F2|nr:uncharacterized protein LOC123534357 [Mercenaria mercenaria]XP_045172517.2 uncharacterized protein LOC123534357 [Mercenaria mercenaria]
MDKLSQELIATDQRIRVNKDTEVRRIQRSIEKTITTILERVKLIDKRLSLRLRKVGSFYDGLKIGLPDEFDFLAELVELKEGQDVIVRSTGFNGTRNLWKTTQGKSGRRKIQYVGKTLCDMDDTDEQDEAWMKQVGTKRNPEYIIDCISVKNTFYSAVLKVVRAFTSEDLPRYLTVGEEPTFIHGPAVTLEFIWHGRRYKNLKISVDLTICIKADNWKTCFDTFEWILEDSCISQTLSNALDRDGYHLTPYISERGHSCQWRVSTSYTEHLLMESFDFESKLKIAIRCLKHERDQYIDTLPEPTEMLDQKFANVVQFVRLYQGEDEEQQLISSYMIKTTAFTTLGLLTSKWFDRIPISIMYTYFITRLYTSIKFNALRMFFISDYKLRVPEFGEILPGFKALVDSVSEEDVPKFDLLRCIQVDTEQCSDEELEFIYTYDTFKQMKIDVHRHYNFWWKSWKAYTVKDVSVSKFKW